MTHAVSRIRARSLTLALLAASCLVAPGHAFAQVKAANGATSVYTAPNGVPVVDIANPNGAGLSHNKYTDYNVDKRGLVLNNGDKSQIERQSQLAGAVAANLKLSKSASVILNEVVSTNRSTLAGYTEVVGPGADVVVANPNGITCNGCGFINTPRVSLTTGTPLLDGATGALNGFHVPSGDILITGDGIDGSAQDYLGLISRSMKIEGQINAKQLDLIAGANDVDYATKAATAIAGSGSAPTLAVDSSALGGMYANRIRLIATEAGVGVRMLGDAAASADDFTIDSAGKVEIGGHISAEKDIKITSTAAATDSIKADGSALSAHRDIALAASGGNVHLVGGALTAARDMSIDSASVTDEASAASGADNNKRYAAGDLALTQTGTFSANGTSYGAGGLLALSADTTSIGADGATFYGDALSFTANHDLALGIAALQAQHDLSLTSTLGKITDSADAAQGIESVLGNITLTSATGLTNAGAISAGTGGIVGRMSGSVSNTGTIQAKDALDLADAGNGASAALANQGTIFSEGALSIKTTKLTNLAGIVQGGSVRIDTRDGIDNDAKILSGGALDIRGTDAGIPTDIDNAAGAFIQADGTLSIKGAADGNEAQLIHQNGTINGDALDFNLLNLTNDGTIQGRAGASVITVSGTLTNNAGKTLTLATASGASGTINASAITNSGTIQSAGDAIFNIGSTLTNNAGAKIISAADTVMRGLSAAVYNIRNYSTIQADGLLDIKGFGAGRGVNIYTNAADGKYIGGTADIKSALLSLADNSGLTTLGDMTVDTTDLSQGGSGASIVAAKSGAGLGTITVGNAFTNIGFLFSKGDLTVNAAMLTNGDTAGMGASGTLRVNTTNNFDNFGQLFAGTLLSVSTPGHTFANQSTGRMDATYDISISSDIFTNNNDVVAGRDLTIASRMIYNEIQGGDTRAWGSNVYTENGQCDPYSYDRSNCSAYDVKKEGISGSYDETHYYRKKWYQDQYYTGITPTEADRPILAAGTTAGSDLTLQGFDYARNLGGIISGYHVALDGNGGSQFKNDAYALDRTSYETKWDDWCDRTLPTDSCDWTIPTVVNSPRRIVTTSSYSNIDPGVGASVFSYSLTGRNSGSLTNTGSVYTPSAGTHTPPSGETGDSLDSTAGTTGGAALGVITITLPSNPNGIFVVSKDPNSKYLIETNPLYGVGSAFLGSDYMLERYGVDPDTVQRRLGDANYEASLIREQLQKSGAGGLLVGGEDEAAAMQKLMDNGVDNAKALGLTVGKAPTAEQLAGLKGDMVWMVEVEVDGQKVLAPQVFLSAETKSQIASGAVISTVNMDLQLASLTNAGGTISASGDMNVISEGDITNTSGTIKGGNVSLASTKGSIVNETYAHTTGDGQMMTTDIGKTAGIESTGNLNLDAGKDITNKGANMSAGGDASLKAGGDITFDTIENKTASTTRGHTGDGGGDLFSTGSSTETTVSSTKQIGSGLTVGGNLKTESGRDTTFAGSDVTVGGNADLNAGGDLNIIARNDSSEMTSSTTSGGILSGSSHDVHDKQTTNVGSSMNIGGNLNSKSGGDTTIQGSNIDVKGDGSIDAGGDLKILDGQNTSDHSESSGSAGLGVGGGVYGTSTTTDTHQKGDSVASNLNFGGNGSLKSGNDITVQGSNVGAGGDLALDAKNDVNVLEGRNTETTTHTESTTTFGKIDMGEGYEAPEDEAAPEEEKGGVNAHAEAKASAGDKEHGGVTLSETDIDSTTHHTDTASGSSIKSGGNMTVKAGNDVTVRGSDVEAGGNADIDAKNVNVLAAEDIDTTTSSHTTAKVGLYGSTKNSADAEAEANAHAQADGEGSPEASADVSASAHAGTENTLDLVRVDKSSKTTTDLTHTGSSIKSGGDMNVNAGNKLNVNGSALESGGDMNLDAKDMSFTAANDVHTETSTDSHTRAGLYADANAGADASASVGAKGLSAGGEMSADASADAGVGLYGSNTTNSNASGSTHAQTSSIKSGGNMTRTAENNITDEGTQIEAGGDFTQSSKSWDSKAAHDTAFSTSSSESNTAKLGLYAEANAGASADASTMGGVSNENGADASAGISASYNRTTDDESSSSSHAVVSNIKSGGNMKTTTTDKTSLEGTNLASGGDMELNAGSLDYKAAHDTESSSSSKSNIDAGMKVGVDATKEVTASIEGGYGSENSSESSSHAVVGSMTSGGNMKVNTKGDANFEGTNLDAGGDAAIDAGGNVNFSAAHDTHESHDDSLDVGGSLSASKGKSASGKGKTGMGASIEGGYDTSDSSSDDAVAGSIKSGGNLSVTSGKSATFEGTKMDAGGDASVEAKDDVNFNAAKSTSTSTGWGVGASLSASKGGKETSLSGKTKEKGTSGAIGVNGSYSKSDSTTSDAASIKSGGKVNVKSGHDVNLEGTNIESGGSTTLDAGHDVNFKAAENTSNSIGVGGGLGGSYEKSAKKTGKTQEAAEKGGSVSLDIHGGKSSTKTGGSIKSGSGITIKSGNDTNLEGTKTESAGDTTINAGGNVNLKTADSSDIHGGIGGGAGTTGGGLTRLSIGGGEQHDGVQMKTGGDMNISSGGKTVMEGTRIDANGDANIDAKGGVEKSTAVSGGANLGLDHAGVDLDVEKTEVNAKGNKLPESPELKEVMNRIDSGKDAAPPSKEQAGLQKAIDDIKNDKSLAPKVKEQKLKLAQEKLKTQKAIDQVRKDPNLTKAQKDKLLKELMARQKALGK